MSGPACGELVADLVGYLDGDLDIRRVRRVEAHLEQCTTCQACAAELRATIALIRAGAYGPVDPDQRGRMKERLRLALSERLR
jgi:anti-sigma factor RsiW